MKKIFFAFVLMVFMSYSCANFAQTKDLATNGTIHLNITPALSNEGIAFENIVESIDKIIPLQQNTADAIVASVMDCIVTNEYIYILDTYEGKGIAVFDIDGNFVTRIKRGGGPGDINQGITFFYDNDNESLFVFDFFFIKEYTKKGEYVKSYPIDYKEMGGDIKDIKKIPGGFLAAIQSSYEQCHIVKLNSDLNILWKTKLPILSQELPKAVVQGYGSNLWVVRGIDNDIYKFDDDSLKVFYHLDFKDYEYIVKKEYHGQESVKYYIELMRSVETGKYIFHNTPFSESQNYLSFSMWNGHDFTSIFYNTRTKKIIKTTKDVGSLFYVIEGHKAMGKGNVFFGRISPERISESSKWNWNGINPNNLLSDKNMAILNNAKADDNPIIVIYKLKSDIKQ